MVNRNLQQKRRAEAIVSNHGGNPLTAHPDIFCRSWLITRPEVDLYARSGCRRYRRHTVSWPAAPANYLGKLPGDWPNKKSEN